MTYLFFFFLKQGGGQEVEVLKRAIKAAHSSNRALAVVFIVWFIDAAAMCFYSASLSLFNLGKNGEKNEVSFSKGSGQQGNIYTGQIHTRSNDEECVERLASSWLELITNTHRNHSEGNQQFININLLWYVHLQESSL